ncbi:hypothetical protein [Hirschia baltica]|uniref:DoxX family protein n=1 Tax=Hirschia baltica (strain ATCC 49814 / DSM 5838 / IFAM 1418) TaxID=582402 RepID=C6XI83_HIRBI|nr:hypothetical protein [Hirschia baltica]ACT58909.1 hypothetical protein Hbal_1217 [Hirschia baltica ATCC 49814]
MRGVRSFLGWVLALGLIIVLAFSLDAKLFDDPEQANVVYSTLAEKTGLALFEPTGRYVMGMLEGFAALMLVLPFTRRFGAFLTLVISGALVGAHLSPYLGQEIPIALGSEKLDGASHFYLMIALVTASGLLMFIHPGRKRRRTFN